MRNKKPIILVVLGAVLILLALSLALYNKNEDAQAGEEADSLLVELRAAIGERSVPQAAPTAAAAETETESESGEPAETPAPLDPNLPEVVVGGYGCIGYLTIPNLELELPVMAEWDYIRLRSAPCRQFGSSRTDDLVIAAHNYDRHFGRLKDLSAGDSVLFTDMVGIVNRYAVTRIETLEPDAVAVVLGSESDLVLYTCTKGGAKRVSVFCDRTD